MFIFHTLQNDPGQFPESMVTVHNTFEEAVNELKIKYDEFLAEDLSIEAQARCNIVFEEKGEYSDGEAEDEEDSDMRVISFFINDTEAMMLMNYRS